MFSIFQSFVEKKSTKYCWYLWGVCLSFIVFIFVDVTFPSNLFLSLRRKGNKCVCLIHRVYWEVASLPITEHFMCIYGFNQASSASRVLPRLSGPSLQWANVLNPFLLMPQFRYHNHFQRPRHLGSSLAVQLLGLGVLMARALVQSLIGQWEPASCMAQTKKKDICKFFELSDRFWRGDTSWTTSHFYCIELGNLQNRWEKCDCFLGMESEVAKQRTEEDK